MPPPPGYFTVFEAEKKKLALGSLEYLTFGESPLACATLWQMVSWGACAKEEKTHGRGRKPD